MLQFGCDPIQRTQLLQTFASWHAGAAELAAFAADTNDTSFRTGIAQCVGFIPKDEIGPDGRDKWIPILERWYTSAHDTTSKSTGEWVLRRWGCTLPTLEPKATNEESDWYVNPAGMTMVKVDPGVFTMGSWTSDDLHELPRRVDLTRPFYIADREITVELLTRLPQHLGTSLFYHRDPAAKDAAADRINVFSALAICNWLSEQEGLEPRYVLEGQPDSDGLEQQWCVRSNANGYRFPTEAEWEYACRAGTITDYPWGQAPGFHQCVANGWDHGEPPLPNPWGLFGMPGGCAELCADVYGFHGMTWDIWETIENPQSTEGDELSLRDSPFRNSPKQLRCSARQGVAFGNSLPGVGFRPVRNAPDETGLANDAPKPNRERIRELTNSLKHNAGDCGEHLAERGRLYLESGQLDAAASDFARLLDYVPDHESWGSPRTPLLVQLSDYEALTERISRLRPDDAHLALCRGRYDAFHGRWKDAADHFEHVIRSRNPRKDKWTWKAENQEWLEYALLLALSGQTEKHDDFCNWVAECTDTSGNDLVVLANAMKIFSITPPKNDQAKQRLATFHSDFALHVSRNKYSTDLGIVDFRVDQLDRMIELWRSKPSQDVRQLPYLAMAHWNLGNHDKAKEVLEQARQLELHPDITSGWPHWWAWLISLEHPVVLAEAEELIAEQP
jgi:formylglycine-generating enzyme required for sulfatase activity/tetratricopeptide (TPR) repeat protein